MKEYLKRLAAGDFVYNEPKLTFDNNRIEIQAALGSNVCESFTVEADEQISGIVWSSNERVAVIDKTFSAKKVVVHYTVNTQGLRINDSFTGSFVIVSNAGQLYISYEVKVVPKAYKLCQTDSVNIFHFANMVQLADDKTEKIFNSDNFKEMFLEGQVQLQNIYDLLKNSSDTQSAIDELLIAAHKKQPVTFEISEYFKKYQNITDNIQDGISVKKSSWGYIDISVATDCSFIKLSSDNITSDVFTGKYYDFQYVIDYSRLHYGNNFGRIIFTTYNQVITCEFEVFAEKKISFSSASSEAEYIIKKNIIKETRNALSELTKEYLSFRIKKKDTIAWLSASNQILDRIRGIDGENVYFKLVQAQLCFMQQRIQEGEWLLESVAEEVTRNKNDNSVKNIELYSYYLYVSTLYKKDEQYTKKVIEAVKKYYENGYDTWRILWLLFYLDKGFARNESIKLSRIKDMCHNGCTSPVMYIEAISVMNTQPLLVRVLNSFEIRVLQFGCRYNLITEKLAYHVAELIGNEKCASLQLIELLSYFNRKYSSDETLTPLVTHMIRNSLTGTKYFELYEKAVLRGLRITRLYECYIMSVDRSKWQLFPKMVLMYFKYDANLNDMDKAYIYADILINERSRAEIIKAYTPNIEHFAYEQLKNKKINDSLLVIYKNVWSEKLIDEQTAVFMLQLMFTYKITCFDKNIKYVLVKHKELKLTKRYQITDGMAYIQMYTDNCAVVFEDIDGVLRKDSLRYEQERIFENIPFFDRLREENSDSIYVNLYLYENYKKYQLTHREVCKIAVYLLAQNSISDAMKYELNCRLINYYYEYYDGDDFKGCMNNIDSTGLYLDEAVKLIELCITYELYDKAVELIKQYGFSGVAAVKLFRFVRRMIILKREEDEELLISICRYVFENKKYDENVLLYLVDNYNGTNEQMYEVWRAADNFGVDTGKLAERIIAQMLFTKQINIKMSEVFKKYYADGGRRYIIKAYIAYNAYLYFTKNAITDEFIFKVIYQQLSDNEELADICCLALLKWYSQRVSELDFRQLDMAQNILNRMCRHDWIFEFYKNFRDVLVMPYNAVDKTVAEYYSKPGEVIEIYYIRENSESAEDMWHKAVMKECISGIYINCFTLFYGESIRYYFVTEDKGKKIKSQVYNILFNNVSAEQLEGRFNGINDMLASRELHDMATMRKLMNGYCIQDYIVNQIFKPIDED